VFGPFVRSINVTRAGWAALLPCLRVGQRHLPNALRVVIHLSRKADTPYFVKIGKRVSHVTLVRTAEDLRTIIFLA